MSKAIWKKNRTANRRCIHTAVRIRFRRIHRGGECTRLQRALGRKMMPQRPRWANAKSRLEVRCNGTENVPPLKVPLHVGHLAPIEYNTKLLGPVQIFS